MTYDLLSKTLTEGCVSVVAGSGRHDLEFAFRSRSGSAFVVRNQSGSVFVFYVPPRSLLYRISDVFGRISTTVVSWPIVLGVESVCQVVSFCGDG